VLQPGLFAAFPGTALDEPVEFSNDIYSARCYPLYLVTGWSETAAGRRSTGRLLLWINRAHVTAERVFISPCDVAAPASMTIGRLEGYVSSWWFEAMLVDTPDWPRITLRRLVVPGWSDFSNPEFCGRYVAFWSLARDSVMTGHIVDLHTPSARRSMVFGRVDVGESDMGWGVPAASWDKDCTAATFRAESHQPRTLEAPNRRSR
jgi:hypothetical protein